MKLVVQIPCLNEETTIQGVLEAICQQTYPLNCIEVLIADGLSQDGTRAGILLFQQKHRPYLSEL